MQDNVLLIDDDRLVHKIVRRSIEPSGFVLSLASDGKEGFAKAIEIVPDVILLDVEMPGDNGYTVCSQLRDHPITEYIPIVFLSSHASINERLQGYEVGADDYLTKPFEAENLVARLKVLSKYRRDRLELQAQYRLAQNTAMIAMSGTSEFALAVQYMEKILTYQTVEEILNGLLEVIERLFLDAVILLKDNGTQERWFSTNGTISPLEKELVATASDKRFLDFGCRTLVRFDPLYMLVRNMPIEDMERYGRVKDLMPVLLSATETKLNSIQTQMSLMSQSSDLKQSFSFIRRNLFNLAKNMVEKRVQSQMLGDRVIEKLTMDMISLGLEEDQEASLLAMIDNAFHELVDEMDVGPILKDSLSFIVQNLQTTVSQHDLLLAAFEDTQKRPVHTQSIEDDNNIELF